ncbi:PAS domain S-box protein [Oceanicella actignis]|uniref:histidine kinase n=1 Tax=Oceanicella actignis TaxID=1189325 RepID=A0A1M7SSP3_9RHOB|nr:PAS domain S-box protein [Oceanicella actignis]SES69168.1 PAS domain S-box-containing protein [Oceanicella actignis]SHN61512.1 PAS domain S-box-containing protein [Oceanicella actignis]
MSGFAENRRPEPASAPYAPQSDELAALRDEVARLRAELDACPDLILELDAEGRCAGWRGRPPARWPLPPAALMGARIDDALAALALDPAEPAAALAELTRATAALDAAAPPPRAMLGLKEGDSEAWFELTAMPVAAPSGKTELRLRVRDVTTERRRAERLDWLEQTARESHHLVVMTDAAQRITWVNPAFERRSGYSLEEARGKRPSELLHFDGTDPAVKARIRAALAAGRPAREEIRNRAKNGETYWIETNILPRRGRNGEIVGYLALQSDITERKLREAELERSRAKAQAAADLLRDAIETLPHAFLLTDAEDRLVMWNKAYARMNCGVADLIRPGVPQEELVRAAIERGLLGGPDSDPERFVRKLRERNAQDEYRSEIELLDGTVLRIFERRVPGGGRVSLRMDVTETVRAQRRLAQVIEGARVGTWLWDIRSGENIINDRWAQMLGYQVDELRPVTFETWRRLTHPDDLHAAMARLRRCIDGETDAFEAQFRMRHKDGRWIWIEARGRVLQREADGSPRLMSGVHMDVTARKEAFEALRYREELLEGLVELATVGIMLYDYHTGRIEEANPALAETLGIPREKLPGIRYREVFLPDGLAEAEARARAQMAVGERFGPFELTVRRSDGQVRNVLVNGVLVQDDLGRKRIWSVVQDITEDKIREAEREAALEAASTARRQLLEAIEALPDAFALYDADDRMVLCNERYKEYYPRSAHAMVPGASFEQILRAGLAAGEYVAALGHEEEWLRERLAQHARCEGPIEQRLADGRWVRVLEKRTAEGGWVGMRIDVTALKEAEQRLADIIEGAQVGTWQLDMRSGRNPVNRRWAEMLGYSLDDPDAVTADDFMALLHPDDRAKIEKEHAEILAGKDMFENEVRLRHRDGHYVWILSRGRVTLRAPTGEPLVTSGVHIDISEQKAREQALEAAKAELERAMRERDAAEKRFYDIISVSDDWVWEQDENLRFTFLSDNASRQVVSQDAAEVLGKTREEYFADRPEVLASADWQALARKLERREPFRNFVYMAPHRPGGERRWIRIGGTPVFDENGAFKGYRGLGSDVTEIVEAAERAEEANRAKSLFLATMSHEIRTPLNGVLGMAELLEERIEDPEGLRMIGAIRQSGETLLNILNDLLDMSKIEAGKLTLEAAPFAPAEAARRVADVHAFKAAEKGLTLRSRIDSLAEAPRLGDQHRVQQILHNLLSNAVKFTESGEIELQLRVNRRDEVVIDVRDDGIGMTRAQQKKLFEDFAQADSTISRRFGGTGLGMAIVRRLVEMMQGRIHVRSAPGKGTRVTVALPLPRAETPPAAGEAEAEAPPIRNMRVLAADDTPSNRMIMEAMLRGMGVEAVLVENGLQAVEAARRERFDALLLDISMPEMDGMEALDRIRRDEAERGLPPTPAAAITANAMTHQVAEYLERGFDRHVPKPFRREDLQAALEALRRVAPEG